MAGTDNEINLFYASDPHDRICTLRRVEQFRARYRVSKVTTKMLFSVNFFTCPIDHFLSSADGDRYVQERVVTHDSTHWGGAEPAPTHTITRADQLQRALYVIQDAATQWYTDSVARVFRAVLHDATTNIVPAATPQIINAMMNLYVTVFSTLFANLLAGTNEWEFERIARRAMRRDSPEYQQYVNQVLSDAMMNAVFRPIGQRHHDRPQGLFRPRIQDARRPPPGGTGGPARGTVIPEPVRAQIPLQGGRSVCLRFQVQKGCDFPRCQHSHSLSTLPAAVLTWLVGAHGPLRRDHPQSS
ncbi:hypothetical protein PINS_up002015 [Pythium insidiosum]|nr:hypothetical protein PINS_up002015 [Pythium insidiosum]